MIYEDLSAQYLADLVGVPVEVVEGRVVAEVNDHLRRLYHGEDRPPRARLTLVPLDGPPDESEPRPPARLVVVR